VHAISGTPVGVFRTPAERLLSEVCSDLAYAQADEIVAAGLHEYLDALQARMNLIGAGIYETFFARQLKGPPARRKAARTRAARRGADGTPA